MFDKILANLPYNPSMIEQASFYSRRLKQEQSIRRLGVIMITLSMFVQIFAGALPPEKSLAYSDNHIQNGVKTRRDLLQAWDNPRSDVATIYKKFGVSRKDIADLPFRPNDTIRSNARNFWSIGRNSLSGYSDINQRYKRNEIALRSGGTTVYMRQLNAWDTRVSHTNYKAFRGTNSTTGETFWILVDCGNYTQIGKVTPKNPQLEIRKSIVGGSSTAKAGDTIKFRIEYRNRAQDSLAENVVLTDNLATHKYDLVGPEHISPDRNGRFTKQFGNLYFTGNSRVLDIRVRLKQDLKTGAVVCNTARINASNAQVANSKVCLRIQNPQPQSRSQPTPTPTTVPTTVAPEKPIAPTVIPVTANITNENVPVGLSKTVSNITQNLKGNKALESAVRPGDVLEYSLLTTNGNDSEITEHEIIDYVGDILDYADIDEEFLATQSGQFDPTAKTVSWADQTLPASGDVTRSFRVVMKDPLPSTNSPSSLTTDFDCKISNQYGDEISLQVQCPFVKGVEQLPNTGPGEAVGAAFVISLISGYFFARSRLLAKEVSIIKKAHMPSAGGK
jgi:uncharacterized repeat protein (TIGR01451 family)